jgi:predicted outer membrane repeat protein
MKVLKTNLLTISIAIILLSLVNSIPAAVINVYGTGISGIANDGVCSIDEAIGNANNIVSHIECEKGSSGVDTIILHHDIVLDKAYILDDATVGNVGTPKITDSVIIDGAGHTVESINTCLLDGNPLDTEFRLFYFSPSDKYITFKNITLKNGCADYFDSGNLIRRFGGAILAFGQLNIENSTFVNNQSIDYGGAIFASKLGTIQSSTFLENHAAFFGGAIHVHFIGGNIENNTFYSNSTDNYGGAIHIHTLAAGSIIIKNNTFRSNRAKQGGAIYNEHLNQIGVSLISNLFSNNSSLEFAEDCSGSFANGSTNASNYPDGNQSGYSGCSDLLPQQFSNADLSPLANNGGSTMTFALSPTSIAVDASVGGTSTDQRGKSVYKIRDLGAYEVQLPKFCTGVYATDGFDISVNSQATLIRAMECSNVNGVLPDRITLSTNITLTSPYSLITGSAGVDGTPVVETALTIDGNGFTLKRSDTLTCNLNGVYDTGEFRLLSNNNSLNLTNITLENGCVDGSILDSRLGGGIYNNGSLSLDNTHIVGNQAYDNGGGIYHKIGTLSVSNGSSFTGNSSQASGGAIYSLSTINLLKNSTFNTNTATGSGGAICSLSTINLLDNSTFSTNTATGSGGAIYSLSTINLLDNSTFNTNTATGPGGAIYQENLVLPALNNVQFNNNSSGASGGAIAALNGSGIIQNSLFSNNSANVSGGGIFLASGTIPEISNSTFSGNTTNGSGGAIDNQGIISKISTSTFSSNNATVNGGAIANYLTINFMPNNTFSGNSSSGFGGAIYNDANINTVSIGTITNNTFSGNSAGDSGGAIYNPVSAFINSVSNTLFHNNSDLNGSNDCSNTGGHINGSNNLSDKIPLDSRCPGLIATRLTSATVKALADNGGPTMTHGLQPGSEALDASVSGLATDQRGLLANGVRDIGAYEAQSNELCSPALQIDGFTTQVANVDELYTAMSCSKTNGNNPDNILLTNDITLLFEYENDAVMGVTGTPSISTPLVIDGQNHIIQRKPSLTCNLDSKTDPGEFRILRNHAGNSLTLSNTKLVNGCADSSSFGNPAIGGGLFNEGDLTLVNVGFNGNKAVVNGGGLYHETGTISQISQSTFSGNTSKFGGGLFNNGTITRIENSTFSGNSANDSGGGIYNNSGQSITFLKNITFSGNISSIKAGAIYNSGSINNFRNSLFHNNTATANHSSDDCFIHASGYTNGSNNMSDNLTGGCPYLLLTALTTTSIGPLADNGGFTQTHALLAGSEAWNAADLGATLSDQRGYSVLDGQRDIGAVEDQPPVITAPADVIIEATAPLTPVNNGELGTAVTNDPDQVNLLATNNAPASLALGSYTVTWTATDNLGHSDTDTQNVDIVDTTPPIITLLGSATVILNIGDGYLDAGMTVTDLVDTNPNITIVNPVNTALAGNYTITYDAVDASGNHATQVTRLVKVQASIGGMVSGLVNTNTVSLSDGSQTLVLGNGAYAFSNSLDTGSSYSVSITVEPIDQTCQISNASGTITTGNINNINVVCGDKKYFVGGIASGLEVANPVILALDTQTLQVNDNGAFVFAAPLPDASNYTVTVDTLPSRQVCVVVNPTGTIAGADIIDVKVNCMLDDNMFSDGFEN